MGGIFRMCTYKHTKTFSLYFFIMTTHYILHNKLTHTHAYTHINETERVPFS